METNTQLRQYLEQQGLKPNPEGLYDGIGLGDFKGWAEQQNLQIVEQRDELVKYSYHNKKYLTPTGERICIGFYIQNEETFLCFELDSENRIWHCKTECIEINP